MQKQCIADFIRSLEKIGEQVEQSLQGVLPDDERLCFRLKSMKAAIEWEMACDMRLKDQQAMWQSLCGYHQCLRDMHGQYGLFESAVSEVRDTMVAFHRYHVANSLALHA